MRHLTLLVGCLLGIFVTAFTRGAEERPPSFENSLGMRLVQTNPGKFLMGSESGDFDERPLRHVLLTQAYFLAATEVTNAQYEAFDPSHRALRGKLGYSTEDDEAVVFVSWEEAVNFCEWLSHKEGKPYRLPTEAEWESACRAETTTAYSTGDKLPEEFLKNPKESWFPGRADKVVSLKVATTPSNPWGFHDMHGNVEEWCADWYGPYPSHDEGDPVGPATGTFRVCRGGSHSTLPRYLRSANRMGTLPEDKSWLIGFRVALGERPQTKPTSPAKPPRNQSDVKQRRPKDLREGPDPKKPTFRGPRQYVNIPSGSEGPLFSHHNHCPAIVPCPNGDLLAIWYTCRREPGRELGICASRLRHGEEEWEAASPFWDAPDRNDHASALWVDEEGRLYHFNGLSAAATWGSLATILRTSTDNGATWSKARLIRPEHGLRHMPIESLFRKQDGTILLPCDAVTGGSGGSAVILSQDNGKTWFDPGEGKSAPTFADGSKGAWIAGIHAPVVELRDGRLLAFGRGNNIQGHMPKSVSSDGGKTWTYSRSPFPAIGGGQRAVLLRLQEGPIFFASFAKKMSLPGPTGKTRPVSGLFAALSLDEGETWPVRRLITDGKPSRRVDGGGNTGQFTLGPLAAEPRGYLSICQTPDGMIQLIASKQHYAFNLAWIQAGRSIETCRVWEKVEITLNSKNSAKNPYTDVQVWVDLEGPGFSKRCYGFWDGGTTFRVRILAPTPGTWTWRSGSQPADPGLQGKSGSFRALAWGESEKQKNPCRRGMIRATPNGHAFQYADGTPYFLLGDTWWATPTFRYPWFDDDEARPIGPKAGFKDYVRYRKRQHYNCFAMIAAFPNWANDGKPARLKTKDGSILRAAWRQPGTQSAKDMHTEAGQRAFLFPGKVPGYEDIFPDLDRINPQYFHSLDRKVDYLNAQGCIPFIEVARRDIGQGWKKHHAWPDSYSRYIQYVWSRYQANICLFSPIHFDTPGHSILASEWNAAANRVIDTHGHPPFGTLAGTNSNPSTLQNFGHVDRARWLSYHQIGNRRTHDLYAYLTEIFHASPPVPGLNGEPYYDGMLDAPSGSKKAALYCRSAMYGSVLSGGLAGHIYGAGGWDGGMWGGNVEEAAENHIWDAIQWPSADQLRHLKTFVLSEGSRYQDLVPKVDLVSPNKTGKAKSCTGWAYCARTRDKGLFLVYFEMSCPGASLSGARPGKDYTTRWFNPRKGVWVEPSANLTANAEGKIRLPLFPGGGKTSDTDWALKLLSK